MSTPEANFETALDESSDVSAREEAIHMLEAANECDMLANLVTRDDVGDRFRERALNGLGHPQCQSMLKRLVRDESLPDPLRDQGETLLDETPGDAGAGP